MEIIAFRGGLDRNLSYIIHDKKGALIVDPFENVEIYFKKVEELNLKILGAVNTHFHMDHTGGNKPLEKKGIKILNLENKKSIKLANEKIKIIKTPGHTNDCKCFYFNNDILTGDVLLAKRVGMAFKKENTPLLYKSIQKLKKLPKETRVWPGHYYNSPFPFTLKEELERNPYLKAKSLKEFTEIIDRWRKYMEKLKKD